MRHSTDDPKKVAVIRRKAPKFYYNAITRTLYHQSHDVILLRFLSHKEAQETLKEPNDGMCGAHQLVQNLEIDSKDLDIIGQKWSLMASLMLSDAMPVRSVVTLFIRHQDIFVLWLLPGYLKCSEWTWLVHQPTFIQWTAVFLSHNRLLFQIGWSYPLKGGKDIWHDQVH